MIRDPLYRAILEALEAPLDAEAFESCANELLRRSVLPTLAPIVGGSDGGMDGAIADGEGGPFTLVCTTAQDVLRNVRGSLQRRIGKGDTRRKAIVVTSRHLTPRRIENLHEAAASLGFVLVQVYTQEWVGRMLYQHPDLRLELLGIPGDVPALSAFPLTSRPLVGESLVGRSECLDRFEGTSGDIVLVGQPGSGKTFLLHALARQDKGLFVVDDNLGRVADAVRAESPPALFIDDAHIGSERVTQLRHLRQEIGADFRIVATCWPGARDRLVRLLDVESGSAYELPLLTRDEIVEVIKARGIQSPVALVRELVNQSAGLPGLAVSLCEACLKRGVAHVAVGDALYADIQSTYDRLVGGNPVTILAAFAVGGECGMGMQDVADCLRVSLPEIQNTTVQLAFGGVLHEVDRTHLAVRPPALRSVLVRETFFGGPTSLGVQELVARAPRLRDVVLTIVDAAARGGQVNGQWLADLVQQANADEVWDAFAWLGGAESQWILDKHPGKLMAVAAPALLHAPEKAVPLLMHRAIGDDRQLHSAPDHPLRIIQDWVKSARPGTTHVPERRRLLLQSAVEWANAHDEADVVVKTAVLSLSPAFEDSEPGAGSGHPFIIRRAHVTLEDLAELRKLWPGLAALLARVEITDWAPVFDVLQQWAYPGGLGLGVDEAFADAARAFAPKMLTDLVLLASNHQGVLHRAREIAQALDVDMEIPLDPDFEALYPLRADKDWQEAQRDQSVRAAELAKEWRQQEPRAVVERLLQCDRYARTAGVGWASWASVVCLEVARTVRSPAAWLRALADAAAPGDLAEPFLVEALALNDRECHDVFELCLQAPSLRLAAMSVLLRAPESPVDLVDRVLTDLGDAEGDWIQGWCRMKALPEDRVRRLLCHQNEAVAVAAATGVWHATRERKIPDSLAEEWRAAVVGHMRKDDYILEEVLQARPDLGRDWLKARVAERSFGAWPLDTTVESAAQALNDAERRELISKIDEGSCLGGVVRAVVGDSVEAYRHLLATARLECFHLAPLGDASGVNWTDKALLALEAGYTPQDIAAAVHLPVQVWHKFSSMYELEAGIFRGLCENPDSRIREIGSIGLRRANANLERELRRERDEDVYGDR